MSAKGRGRHDGGEFDYYPTPAWCVERLLDRIGGDLIADGLSSVIEPTCGDGAIVRAMQAWLRRTGGNLGPEPEWTGIEIRTDALAAGTRLDRHVEGIDYRQWAAPQRFDLAAGNPPYNIAEAIIRKALRDARVVAMLLRTGFLGSDERVDFWRTVGKDPALYVLPDRPSFDGVGSDSATYAWFVWGGEFSGVHMLDSTPLAVRNAQKPQGLSFEKRQPSLFAAGGSR